MPHSHAYIRNDGTIRRGRVVGTILSLVVVGLAVPLIVYALTYSSADVRGRIALHNQQRSATALQFSYEFFHESCRSVIAESQQLETLKAQVITMESQRPASDPFGQWESQLVQLQTQVTGLSNIRDSAAQDYNAKSHEFTHNFIRSKDLPVEIGPPNGISFSKLRCENQGAN